MKQLILMRHAEAGWGGANTSDFDRELELKGIQDTAQMGRLLAENGLLPELILSSPAKRAITTARKIAGFIGYPLADISEERGIYEAFPEDIISIIKPTEASIKSLMVFGHNPGLTELANQLGNGRIMNLATCGVVGIRLDIDSWEDISSKKGQQFLYEYPS